MTAFVGLGPFCLHAPFMAEAPSKNVLKYHRVGIKMNITQFVFIVIYSFFCLFFNLDFKRKSENIFGGP